MILCVFARVTVRVSDLEASRRFYETVLDLPAVDDAWHEFALAAGGPTTGLHVAFAAWSRRDVDAFWRRGVDDGYRSDGEPGPRTQYGPEYYGGFLLDPDGNSVEAVFHGRQHGGGGLVDHLWIGVDDLSDAKRRYSELGLQMGAEHGDHVHVAVGERSLVLVADGRPPTRNLALAVPAPDGSTVEVVIP
jgi:catechol 2,3-dioxygenase-like lactoylglutathione lyase family enzyme